MSKEAELLRLIDSLAAQLLAGRTTDDDPGRVLAALASLSDKTAECASALELDQTRIRATGIAMVARQGCAAEELANLLAAIEEGVEELQLTAERELECHLKGAAPTPEPLTGVGKSIVAEFIAESREHLESIEREMLRLEREPASMESLHAIFRGFHTIKGLAGICGVEPVRALAHEVEAVLDCVRAGRLAVTASLIGKALECADHLVLLVDNVEAELRGWMPQEAPPAASLIAGLRAIEATAADVQAGEPPAAAATHDTARGPEGRSGSVKVDPGKLDQLVDMASELVVFQSRLDSSIQAAGDHRLAWKLDQLGRMASEMQKTALSLRVVPIGAVFQRMARLFRDLTMKSGREAVLELEGEEAELDRTIVERLVDPLMHMVRNAVDHGLESPEERERAGKPRHGTVRLTASHHAGSIVVEVSDDGCGLNQTKIIELAVARGLIASDAGLATHEIFALILLPGFSTVDKVTDVSGRGVGMDVVRRQIEQMRGRVEISSESGKGTTFRLRLPLTLAISAGLVVKDQGKRYIVPLFNVREVLQPEASTLSDKSRVATVHGRTLTVVRLGELLGRSREGRESRPGVMVVLEVYGRRYGLIVDEVLGKQEVVVKNLGSWLGHVPGLFGGAILGDGSVAIILEVESLIQGEVNDVAMACTESPGPSDETVTDDRRGTCLCVF